VLLPSGVGAGELPKASRNFNLHVVKAIVSLARAFGLKTIAEGVEDKQALTLLRAEGVDFAQEFHLGRPGPISDS
jgi:EAL domain-containing protein (putative c-di-GMP-specific phosphodiesterase class I)